MDGVFMRFGDYGELLCEKVYVDVEVVLIYDGVWLCRMM
jgi:hypothetical protein